MYANNNDLIIGREFLQAHRAVSFGSIINYYY